jgi:pyruvate/2-oxoglutarate dehydrogenase complex dihydrolipoamide dehydrogenase (E3) component
MNDRDNGAEEIFMAKYSHDVVILGGGAGGLTAAVGCAQLGMKTALIEKERLGGDCLYFGCVPSKSLLMSASMYHAMSDGERYGLPSVSPPPVDLSAVNARIASVIAEIEKHDSPERFRSLGAEVFFGRAEFRSPHEIVLDGKRTLSAPYFVLATGSSPRSIPVEGLEDAGYFTNIGAFSLPHLPRRIATIGCSPVGVELSQAYRRLGAQVTMIDQASRVLPRDDADMASVVQDRLVAEGIALRLGAQLTRVETGPSGKIIHLTNADGAAETLEADEILLAVGRQGNSADLRLDLAGVEVDKSYVVTDEKLRTTQRHILAIGDVNGRYQFTHVAGAEGSVAVRRIALRAGGSMNYQAVPWCTYTDPELASVGYSETTARAADVDYDVIIQPFDSTDRARAEGETAGKMKILLDRKGRVIGTQIVGRDAGELLAPSLFAVSKRWKIGSIMAPVFPYPTLSELHKKAVSTHMAPRLFNDRIRGILRLLFRYRGTAGKHESHVSR